MTEEQRKQCEEHINNYNYKMQDARKWWENTEYLLISLSRKLEQTVRIYKREYGIFINIFIHGI